MITHKWIIIAFLCLFGSMLCLVSFTAYTRRSGNTGLDMAKIQQVRTMGPKTAIKK